MKVGDHVRLADHAAAQMASHRNWKSKVKINWPARRGVVVKRQLYGEHLVGVLWKGRSSVDYWRQQLLVVVDEK